MIQKTVPGSRMVVVGACALCALAVLSCGPSSRDTVLLVRTTLPQALADYVEESFEAEHRDVNIRFTGGEDEESLAEALSPGGARFDVWWGAPALSLAEAAEADLLEPHRPPWVQQPGVGEPDAQARWQVSLVSPFVIAFNREKVPLNRAPTDWIDLFHFRWSGDVQVLDPVRTDDGAWMAGAMIVEALREDDDLLAGFDWLERLDEQVVQYVGAPEEALRALESGEVSLAILPRFAVEEARGRDMPTLHYRLPESGTPMLALGVAIMKGSEVTDAARRFVGHLGRPDVATEAKLHTRWQPAHGDVNMSRFPPHFELDQRWTPYALAVDTLRAELDGWIDRWDLEIRGR